MWPPQLTIVRGVAAHGFGARIARVTAENAEQLHNYRRTRENNITRADKYGGTTLLADNYCLATGSDLRYDDYGTTSLATLITAQRHHSRQ